MPNRKCNFTPLAGCIFVALGFSLPGCMSFSRATYDIDRTPIVNTGTRASIIYPGQAVPMPVIPSSGNTSAGTAPQQQSAGSGNPAGVQTGSQSSQATTPPREGQAAAPQSAAPSDDGITFIGGARQDEKRHIDVREDPLMVKYLTAPLALIAAPFVLAKEALQGDPEPGPAIPPAGAPSRPPAPAVAVSNSQPPDYETAMLQNLERELDQRQASQHVSPAPRAQNTAAAPSIADELRSLQRAPELSQHAVARSSTPIAEPLPAARPETSRANPYPTADGIVDRNDDGRIDQWIFRANGDIIRQVLDEDFDGRPDRTLSFDPESHQLSRLEEDSDQDGVLDSFADYSDGTIERRRSDADGDGSIDTWSFFRDGELARHEQDTNGDGFRDTTSFFENGVRLREQRDRDGDGHSELVLHYDASEQLLRQEEDQDGDGDVDIVSHYRNGHLARRELLDSALVGVATERDEATR